MFFWPPSPFQAPSQNRYDVLDVLEIEGQANDSGDAGLSGALIRTSQSTRWITTIGVKRERIIVIGSSIMRGSEDSLANWTCATGKSAFLGPR